jgi:uncharacterized membrane protein
MSHQAAARRISALALVLDALHAAAGAPPAYTIQDLGVVPGGGFGFGILINQTGQAIGYQNRTTSGNSPRTGVFWSQAAATDMFPDISDATLIQPQSLNDLGVAIVTVYRPGAAGVSYRWHDGIRASDFVVAPTGTTLPIPWDINNAGLIAGNAIIPATARQTIIRWSADGQTPTVLGTLGGEAAPTHMNSAGDIVGFSYPDPNNNGHIHPFVIRSDQILDLSSTSTTLLNGEAHWISENGLVCGWVFTDVPFGLRNPAAWDAANQRTLLPHLPTSDGQGIAYGINSAGTAVGWNSDSFYGSVAVLWDHGTVYNLAQLIPGGLPDGWVYLAEGRGINDRGQIIGWGSRTISPTQGDIRAFLMTPVQTCYANCDGSTLAPFLNVNDFVCFLQHFASADSYANCDGSTTPPVLNMDDYMCFMDRFAAGCSAP